MIVTGGHLQVPACCLSAAGNAVSGKGRQRIMTETKDYVRKVQYYETDRMGIVHHSNYIRWMEEARTDVLEQIGLPYDKIESAGILIPVLGVSCDYRISFRYSEVFRVKVIPEKFNGIKMSLRYEIYGQEDGKLHAAGETSHCFLDRKMKPVHMKRDYPEIYSRLTEYMGVKEEEESL